MTSYIIILGRIIYDIRTAPADWPLTSVTDGKLPKSKDYYQIYIY